MYRPIRLILALLLGLTVVGATDHPVAAQPAESALVGVVQVTAGEHFSCALLGSGQVRCWGAASFGQLGEGGGLPEWEPVAVDNPTNTGPLTGVSQISAGEAHACARLTNGRSVCWGINVTGQIGDNSLANAMRPVSVLNAAGTNPLSGVAEVGAGSLASCARLTSGQVRCWGENVSGQLGDDGSPADSLLAVTVVNPAGTGPLTGATDLDVGTNHACVVVGGGQVRCWGLNGGRLGNGATASSDRPVAVVGVLSNRLTGATQVAAGEAQTCARLGNGRLVCWGFNSQGQLGDGTFDAVNRPTPVANSTGDGDLAGVAQVDAGPTTTCARLTNGQARCWGGNADGQLGDGDGPNGSTVPAVVRNSFDSAALRNVVAVAVGFDHSCARLANGQVRCWGDNGEGQLGNASTTSTDLPVVVHFG